MRKRKHFQNFDRAAEFAFECVQRAFDTALARTDQTLIGHDNYRFATISAQSRRISSKIIIQSEVSLLRPSMFAEKPIDLMHNRTANATYFETILERFSNLVARMMIPSAR
jgi:hypothetical protein